MSCHYTTVHCGNMNVVLHPRVASFCPKRMVEMTENKKWNAADACCWQTLLSSFFFVSSPLILSLLPQEQDGAVAHSGLLPAHQQQGSGQHVADHGSGLQGAAGWRWLPLHDLRLPGNVRTLTSKHWPAALFMYTATSLSAVNMKKVFIYCTMFV